MATTPRDPIHSASTFRSTVRQRRRIATFTALALLFGLPLPARSQSASPDTVATFPPLFEFHSGFWLNLHHFLYTLARAHRGMDAGRRSVALVVVDTAGAGALSVDQRRGFDRALDYYERSVAPLDVFDQHMLRAKTALGDAESAPALPPHVVDDSLAAALEAAAPAYRALWWPRHDGANRRWIAAILPRLAAHGPALARAVTTAFRTSWSDFLIRVDVSGYSSWAGAYTSLYPDRITVSSLDPDYQDASGLEMLFHEALHTYTDSVATPLKLAAVRQHANVPPDLVHALIFYSAGELTRRELATSEAYEPYALRFGIWTRGTFPRYLPILRDELQPYLDGRRSFTDAIDAIVRRIAAAGSGI